MQRETPKKAVRKRKGSYQKGYRAEIMKLLLSTGAISYRGLWLLDGDIKEYQKRIRKMREEGVVTIKSVGSRKMVRLDDFENKCGEYIETYKRGYFGFYINNCIEIGQAIGRYGTEKTRGERACRIVETAMAAYAVGIDVLWEEKEDIRKGGSVKNKANFYLPREIKEIASFQFRAKGVKGDEAEEQVINSRSVGGIFSPGGDYVMYHTGNKVLKWFTPSEGQMMYCFGRVREIHEEKERGKVDSCIILGYSNKPFERMFNPPKKNGVNLVTVEKCGYKHMYQIPYSREGARLIGLMTKENWFKKMKQILLPANDKEERFFGIDCDGTMGDIKVLLYTAPDMVRLRKFLNAAEWDGAYENYHIYCFDFQQSFLESVVEGRASIMVVPFDEYLEAEKGV